MSGNREQMVIPEHNSANDWPLVAEKMSEALSEADIERAFRILVQYYRQILEKSLDDEPSDKLKEGIIKNYGHLNEAAVRSARSIKGSSLIPERQVAFELATLLHAVFEASNDSEHADVCAAQAATLQELLSNIPENELKYIWKNRHQASIRAVGEGFLALLKNESGSQK